MEKTMKIYTDPLLRCYGHHSTLFSLMPVNNLDIKPILHISEMYWIEDNRIRREYECWANNVVITKSDNETILNAKKYSSKMGFNAYNRYNGNSKFVVKINKKEFTQPYASASVYVTIGPEFSKAKNKMLVNFIKFDKTGFYLENNNTITKIDNINANKDAYWMCIEINEATLITSYSENGVDWSIINKKENFSEPYEIGFHGWLGEDRHYPWVFNNFIQIYMKRKPSSATSILTDYFFPQLKMHSNRLINPFIDFEEIHRNLVKCTEIGIIKFITSCIESNNYVSLYLNEYHVPDRRSWNKNSFNHENLVYGYNDEKRTFKLLGYSEGYLRYSDIGYDDFVQAYNSCKICEASKTDVITLIRYKYSDSSYMFDIGIVRTSINDYLTSFDSRKKFTQIIQNDLDVVFGISVYDNILNSQENTNRLMDDVRISHFIYEHKMLMVLRVEYLFFKNYIEETDYLNLSMSFEKICSMALSLRNLVLKYKIAKSNKIQSNVMNLLTEIRDLEKENLTSLLCALNTIDGDAHEYNKK